MKRKRGSMLHLLSDRQVNVKTGPTQLEHYAEDKAAQFELEEMVCKLPVSVRSTFLMCFSPNGTRVASTHGDHKIYVCQVSNGQLLKTLEGHPRTPWCLAFHPTCNDLIASGCLGGEVRVWDLRGGGSEVWVCPERSVITSLSFHPTENFVALSTVNRVHFWDWSRSEPFATTKTASEREKVRLVRFSPRGDFLLTGITNVPPDRGMFCRMRHSSILTRLITMYHRLGEMLPPAGHRNSDHQPSPPPQSNSHEQQQQPTNSQLQPPPPPPQQQPTNSQQQPQQLPQQAAQNHSQPQSRFQSLFQQNSLPRRIGRRGGVRRVTEDDLLFEIMRTRYTDRNRRHDRFRQRASLMGSELSYNPWVADYSRIPLLAELHANRVSIESPPPQGGPPIPRPRTPSPELESGRPSAFSHPGPSGAFMEDFRTVAFNAYRAQGAVPDFNATSASVGAAVAAAQAAAAQAVAAQAAAAQVAAAEVAAAEVAAAEAAAAEAAAGVAAANNVGLANGVRPPNLDWLEEERQSSERALRHTFERLRALCNRIEHRMMRPLRVQPPLIPGPSQPEAPMNQSSSAVEPVPTTLVQLLNRLQESLTSLSEATAITNMNTARRQIREVRYRISEILERLESVSGYRERLRNLREQLFQATGRLSQQEGLVSGLPDFSLDDPNPGQQWDVNYCLWLIETSLRLTYQMQRLLSSDYDGRGSSTTRPPRARRPRLDAEPSAQAPANVITLDSSSESDSDAEPEPERPSPPFAAPPYRPPPFNVPRFPPAGLSALNAVTHRIQYWSISGDEMVPQISDPMARLVVTTCKIHNDGSVDVSPCGRLLVALVPDSVGVTLSVFSLEKGIMGQLLYTWGFGPNAVSVSFSPLSRYVVVGLASSRYISPQRETVAQIFRLGERPTQGQTGSTLLEHVGNMSQPLLGNNATQQLISLNCVRWLPNPGEGLVYGTNRGTLCICRPLCTVCSESHSGANSDSSSSSSPRDDNGGPMRTRRDSSFQLLSQQLEETATRHALLGRRN